MRNFVLRALGRRRGLSHSPAGAAGVASVRRSDAVSSFSISRQIYEGLPAIEILRGRSHFAGPSIPRFLISSGRIDTKNVFLRQFSSINEKDEIAALEEEAERKVGWLLKIFFIGTATFVGFQFFPYMGDNLLQQSVSLLRVKDPLFKRMGASRLAQFAVDDERRMKVVEMGGAQDLLNMLKSAKDDKTRKEALKTLVALSHCDEAAEVLHQAGAVAIVSSTPNSLEYAEVESYRQTLLKRFQEVRPDFPLEVETS